MFYRSINRVTALTLVYNVKEQKAEEMTFTAKGKNPEQLEKVIRAKCDESDDFKFIMVNEWKEEQERRFMTEEKFMALAVKLDKPNPAYVTRTVKDEVVTVYTCHRFKDEFSTVTIKIKAGMKGKERQKAIAQAVPYDLVIRRCESTAEISGLYGMKLQDFIEHSTTENE